MPVTIAVTPTLGIPQKPLRRSSSDAAKDGVAKGFAIRLGLKERTVRILFAISALFAGLGVLAYVALWLFTPRSGEDHSIAQHVSMNRRDKQLLLIACVVALVAMFSLNPFSFRLGGTFAWTLLLCLVGLFGVPIVGSATARGWKAVVIRVLPGVVLVVVGLNILNRIGGVWGAAVPALLGALVLIGGLLILFTPWWLQTVRDLSSERRQRIRMQERTAVMGHIHDSVLQTLTLIERSAASEADVVRLARSQERELRQWLFNPEVFDAINNGTNSFVGLVGAIEHEIENDYGTKVELVTVGDCATDEGISALAAAGREAAINAAKWSGASSISIYAEVETANVSLFVRDTGKGFDVNAIPADRQGIEVSIKQRMTRHGGRALVRSTVGSGTNVELVLPRRATT
jgi:signal transduction histidine kinase